MAITTQQRDDLIAMYVAIPGRAPDHDGLLFWSNALEDGATYDFIAQEMWESASTQAVYGLLTVEETVTEIYRNVLGREPDAEGLEFWIGRWNANGAGNEGETLQEMIDALQNGTSPEGQADRDLFAAKIEFGKYFAVDLGSNDLDLAEAGFDVLEAGGTVEDAIAAVNLDPSEAVILTSGTDFVTTGNNDDTIYATESTLNTSDNLDGGDGFDTLELDINGSSAFFAAPTLDNIELITVTQGGSASLTSGMLDLSDSDIADEIILETNENEVLDWTFADIQSVNNTDLRVIDTNSGVIDYVYDTNAYAGYDVADLTVAEVDCLTVNFGNETANYSPSNVDEINLHSLINGQVNNTTSNYIWDLNVGSSFETLIVDGDADLTIENALDDSVTYVDASGLAADFDIDLYGQGATYKQGEDLSLVDPITVIGAQGDDNIGVQLGGVSDLKDSIYAGANGIYDLGSGNDTLQVGEYDDYTVGGWDSGEDCHDADEDVASKSYGNSTVISGTGNDAIYLYLNGEQSVDTGEGNDYVEIMGDTDYLLTEADGDGESTISTGAGDDEVNTYSDYGNYDIDLGEGDDVLTMEGCEVECGSGDQTVDAGAGDDLVTISMIGDHDVVAGDGADTVTIGCDCDVELGNQTVDTGAGNDILTIIGAGVHDITLGAGDDTLLVEGAWTTGNFFDYAEEDITVVDAGAGNDDLTFAGNHWLDMDLGDGDDTLTLNAVDLTSDDTIVGGDGIDTIVLFNDEDPTDCEFNGDVCVDWVYVDQTATEFVSSVEVFDLRNANIHLTLTQQLFDSAEDNHITVITEESYGKQVIPGITLRNNKETATDDEPVTPFTQGMSREDWDSIVEDWEDGYYTESKYDYDDDPDTIDGNGNDYDFDNSEAGLIAYLQDKGIDYVDIGDEEVFFVQDDECEQVVDISSLTLKAGNQFTLLGGTIKDVVIADEASLNKDDVLRFDSAGGDSDSVEDTLVFQGYGQILSTDLGQTSGLECIVLKGDEGAAVKVWTINLTDDVINQTTGTADLVIWVDSNVPAGSILKIKTDDSVADALNGVVVKGNGNVTIEINGDPVNSSYVDPDGIISIETQLNFTTNTDDLVGEGIFYATSNSQIDSGDWANGTGEDDTLLLAFPAVNPNLSLAEQLTGDDINDDVIVGMETIKFVLPESGNKSVGNDLTNLDIRMWGLGGSLGEDADTVITGHGDDELRDMEGGIYYDLNGGNDYFWAGEDGDPVTVHGAAGDDTIWGGSGNDVINGGADNNDLYGGHGNDTITAEDGNDYIIGGPNSPYVIPDFYGSGEDFISTDDDLINAGNGSNYVEGGYGADTITSGTGADSIWGESGDDVINAGDGNNDVYGGSGEDYITTGTGDDYINGGYDDDVINAGNGENYVDGGYGDDSITTGTGADVIYGGSGDDTIISGAGDDYIEAWGGTFYIDAGADDDYVEIDYLNSSDTIIGGAGSDTLHFEDDDDFSDSDFTNVSEFEVMDLTDENTNSGTFADEFEESGITTILGGYGSDTLDFFDVSGATDLYIDADSGVGSGDDFIIGGAGDDTILLGDGSDTVQGSAGADHIDVGEEDGQDDYVFFVSPLDGSSAGNFDGHDTIVNFETSNDEVVIDGGLYNLLGLFGGVDEEEDVYGLDLEGFGGVVDIAYYTQASQNLSNDDLLDEDAIATFLSTALGNMDEGDNVLLVIQGDSNTGIYYFQSDDDTANVDASEITMLGLFEDASLDQYDVGA